MGGCARRLQLFLLLLLGEVGVLVCWYGCCGVWVLFCSAVRGSVLCACACGEGRLKATWVGEVPG